MIACLGLSSCLATEPVIVVLTVIGLLTVSLGFCKLIWMIAEYFRTINRERRSLKTSHAWLETRQDHLLERIRRIEDKVGVVPEPGEPP